MWHRITSETRHVKFLSFTNTYLLSHLKWRVTRRKEEIKISSTHRFTPPRRGNSQVWAQLRPGALWVCWVNYAWAAMVMHLTRQVWLTDLVTSQGWHGFGYQATFVFSRELLLWVWNPIWTYYMVTAHEKAGCLPTLLFPWSLLKRIWTSRCARDPLHPVLGRQKEQRSCWEHI